MNILAVHNYYQNPGGEDVIFHAETRLLERHGHQVTRYTAHNATLTGQSRPAVAVNTVWNRSAAREVRTLIRDTRPDVMHVHNTFPLISPSIYNAAADQGVPVVQTLHNFRLLCPSAVLMRDGRVCEDCVGTATRWPGVVHGCYRGTAASAVVAAMLCAHTAVGTWTDKIQRYIAISEFCRRKFIEGGLPADKLVVKLNFLDYDPGISTERDGYVLFVGRLSREKGLGTLLEAVSRMRNTARVKVVGQGPLGGAAADGPSNIEWCGHQDREQVLALMKGASLLVMPSEWYEGCPLTIIEAFATGLPVIASRLGTMAEMVTDGVTGRLFPAGDSNALAEALDWALTNSDSMREMALHARAEFERKYTAAGTYQHLMNIYRGVLHS
jgi:glycosyltransferase involved in cell wall biosynthesis